MLNDDLADVLERLMHEVKPKSIRLVIAVQQSKWEASLPNSSNSLTTESTYIETAKGERYFDNVTRISDGRVYRETAYSDGRKSANVMYDAQDVSSISRIGVGHEFMGETRVGYYSAPEPFRYTRVGLIPLDEALPHAEKLARVDVIGRPCDRYLFREVKSAGAPQSLVYALDSATSVPLMVAAYKDVDHVNAERPYWVWEAVTLDTVSGYHYPLKSKYSSYLLTSNGNEETPRIDMTQSIEVKTIEYDVAYPASTFWPKAPAGVTVLDTIAKKTTVVPGPVPPKQAQAKVADPIRVDPSATGDWPAWPGVVLGSSLLTVALVLWIRSKWR